jgi:hypothetical protein
MSHNIRHSQPSVAQVLREVAVYLGRLTGRPLHPSLSAKGRGVEQRTAPADAAWRTVERDGAPAHDSHCPETAERMVPE